MLEVLLYIVPDEYQETAKRFLYYLKTLPDKTYNKDIPNVSQYKVQIVKNLHSLSVINHQHYKTVVITHNWKQIEEIIKLHFEKKQPQLTDEQQQFILDLRF